MAATQLRDILEPAVSSMTSNSKTNTSSTTSSTSMPTITKKHLAHLWVMLTQVFGHRFTSSYGKVVSDMWFDVLKELTPDDLVYGYRKLIRTSTPDRNGQIWPPNAFEFRKLCRKTRADFGLPSTGVAHREACSNRYMRTPIWSHAAVQHASVALGDDVDDVNRFAQTFDALCERVMNGEMLLSVPHNFTERKKLTAQAKYTQQQAMDRIREILKTPGKNKENIHG